MRMRRLFVLLVLASFLARSAQAAEAISKGLRLDGGFQELVVSVPDIEAATAFYQKVAGWRVVHRGAVQPEVLAAWRLPESAKAIDVVLQNPGDPIGFIRLVKFRGIAQEEVRPSARIWDTGGFAGFDVFARDTWQKYTQFRQAGWHAYAQPVQHQVGGLTSIQTLLQGPANEMIGIIQRLDPPLAGFPNLKEMSYAFNVFETVKDFDATVAFYTEKLGLKIFMRDQGLAAPPGRNIYGLPANLVNNVYRRTVRLHPRGDVAQDDHAGSISITSYYGASGDDFSGSARPPNLGLIAARFPVSDAVAKAAELRAKGIPLEYAPEDVGMLPYGPAKVFAIRDPNGAWIEFFEPADKPN
jgi:catechol 2,3-dioxygenase-like lactoylglutathione lyase family enzyme